MNEQKETGLNGQGSDQQLQIGFVQQLTNNKGFSFPVTDKNIIPLLQQIDHKLDLLLLRLDCKSQFCAVADLDSCAALQLIENLIATYAARVEHASYRPSIHIK